MITKIGQQVAGQQPMPAPGTPGATPKPPAKGSFPGFGKIIGPGLYGGFTAYDYFSGNNSLGGAVIGNAAGFGVMPIADKVIDKAIGNKKWPGLLKGGIKFFGSGIAAMPFQIAGEKFGNNVMPIHWRTPETLPPAV